MEARRCGPRSVHSVTHRPVIWAATIAAERTLVATSPNNAQLAQSTSAFRELVCLGGERFADVDERLMKACHTLICQ